MQNRGQQLQRALSFPRYMIETKDVGYLILAPTAKISLFKSKD